MTTVILMHALLAHEVLIMSTQCLVLVGYASCIVCRSGAPVLSMGILV